MAATRLDRVRRLLRFRIALHESDDRRRHPVHGAALMLLEHPSASAEVP